MQALTDRELEVFELIGSGLSTREIAEKLHLSVKTVESHREHIKEKLGLDSATELLKSAIQWIQLQKE
jgi:DNA-binding CsgD family transcriptional regulator